MDNQDNVTLKKIDAYMALKQYEEEMLKNPRERRIVAANNRERFVKQYPIERIKDLTIEEYCKDENSFTKQIRIDLQGLASMGNAYPDTFGLYARKETNEIVLSKTFQNLSNGNVDIAFRLIKKEIVKFLTDFKISGFSALEGIHLNNMYKYKLLIIYYPDEVFPVCARGTLMQYCESVGLSISPRDEMYIGIQKLLDWKNRVPAFQDWNNAKLMGFCDMLVRSNTVIDGRDLENDAIRVSKNENHNNNEWVIACNPNKFDVVTAFNDLKKIDWKQSTNIDVNDIVYIYVSSPIRSIRFKCKVNKTDIPVLEIDDRRYEISSESGEPYDRYMELELIKEFNTDLFNQNVLDKYGFSIPQSPRRVTPKLKEYLDVVQYLLFSKEMDPDKHDGSYELARETVKAYRNMPNIDSVDYRDLNLLYHMVIGTWKMGVEQKKKSIDSSNLPFDEKNRLKNLLDSIWNKAEKHLYENKVGDTSIGMFGTGFYSFNSNDDGEAARTFLKLCIEIMDLEDDNQIFNVAEKYLSKEILGLKAASATVMLHCLKPFTFPILNTNFGNNTIYEYFELGLNKMKNLSTLVSNSRKIKDFRDKYFAVKNYRIFDVAARIVNKADITDDENQEISMASDEKSFQYPLNTILYGPPGTGKTYNSILYAVAICEGASIEELQAEDYSKVIDRFKTYRNEGRIAFTTFHQSYGYEEFIEGIKPIIDDSDDGSSDIDYSIEDGIFKNFCERASLPIGSSESVDIYGLNKNPVVWKVSLGGTGDNPTRTDCLENDHIRIGWEEYGEVITDDTDFTNGGKIVLNSFINKMKVGDIVLSCYSASSIDAIGVVTGEYEWHPEFSVHKRLRKVRWLAKNINYNILELNNNTSMTLATVYKMKIAASDVFKILNDLGVSDKASKTVDNEPFVFIIDEINRGNISKIFGELITLIEPTKRIGKLEELKVELPYSKKQFGVPNNVYILGTMNTADRSIALMDTALRRRFEFIEMMPDCDVLQGVSVEQDGETVDIAKMLSIINLRIEYLYDREHTIGHAYFMELLKTPTIDMLAEIFDKNLIPLLKEYFYEDYGKIQMILGDNKKSSDDYKFIKETKLVTKDIFNGDTSELDLPEQIYSIQKEALYNIHSYKEIAKDL